MDSLHRTACQNITIIWRNKTKPN